MQKISKTRLISYYLLMVLFSLIILTISSELLVRLLVPKETFWLMSNIYRAVKTPGVIYTLKPNFHGTAFGVELVTNSLGFRGKEWSIEKSPNEFRIALIGDSHAFGYGVTFKESVGERLASLLNKHSHTHYEVLNFAISGYNSSQELAVLQTYALRYHPNLVIIIASSNDHEKPLLPDNQGFLHFDNPESPDTRLIDDAIVKIQPKTVS